MRSNFLPLTGKKLNLTPQGGSNSVLTIATYRRYRQAFEEGAAAASVIIRTAGSGDRSGAGDGRAPPFRGSAVKAVIGYGRPLPADRTGDGRYGDRSGLIVRYTESSPVRRRRTVRRTASGSGRHPSLRAHDACDGTDKDVPSFSRHLPQRIGEKHTGDAMTMMRNQFNSLTLEHFFDTLPSICSLL